MTRLLYGGTQRQTIIKKEQMDGYEVDTRVSLQLCGRKVIKRHLTLGNGNEGKENSYNTCHEAVTDECGAMGG
jgi:hypothetical protein